MNNLILIVGFIIWAAVGIPLTIKDQRDSFDTLPFTLSDMVFCIVVGTVFGPVYRLISVLNGFIPWDKKIWPPKNKHK